MPVKKRQSAPFPPKEEYLTKSVEWNVKAIHGERHRKVKGRNQTQYLVEWEPDRDTGETFKFDWVSSSLSVNVIALVLTTLRILDTSE